MLFFRLARESEGRPMVFVGSKGVSEGRVGIEVSAGNGGGCTMDGALDPVRVGLRAICSDKAVGCS